MYIRMIPYSFYRHNMKNFYDAQKTVYGAKSSGSCPLLITDGCMLLTEIKKMILEHIERWTEYFNRLLNRSAQINNKALLASPGYP